MSYVLDEHCFLDKIIFLDDIIMFSVWIRRLVEFDLVVGRVDNIFSLIKTAKINTLRQF